MPSEKRQTTSSIKSAIDAIVERSIQAKQARQHPMLRLRALSHATSDLDAPGFLLENCRRRFGCYYWLHASNSLVSTTPPNRLVKPVYCNFRKLYLMRCLQKHARNFGSGIPDD